MNYEDPTGVSELGKLYIYSHKLYVQRQSQRIVTFEEQTSFWFTTPIVATLYIVKFWLCLHSPILA